MQWRPYSSTQFLQIEIVPAGVSQMQWYNAEEDYSMLFSLWITGRLESFLPTRHYGYLIQSKQSLSTGRPPSFSMPYIDCCYPGEGENMSNAAATACMSI